MKFSVSCYHVMNVDNIASILYIADKRCNIFDYHSSENANTKLFIHKVCKMSSYSRNQNSFHAMSLKKFSDKEPATVQDYGTRKEMKENEQNIKKGFCHIQIAIGITLVTLIVVAAGWGPMYE